MVDPNPTASVLMKERGADTQSRGCVMKMKQRGVMWPQGRQVPQELAGRREGCSRYLQRVQLCQCLDFELWSPEE